MSSELKDPVFHARLKQIIGAEKPFAWAERIGINKATFSRVWNEGTVPGPEHLKRIHEKTGYSIDWMLTGELPIKRGDQSVAAPRGANLSNDLAQEYKPIPLAQPGAAGGVTLPVYVTGGAGDPYELIPADPIEEIIIPSMFYRPSIVPVKVQGRSMEGTLRNGAVVGVDRADRRVVNGELYAVWLPYQGAVIKRLYIDDKKILLQSDNEEFRSHDIAVDITDADEHFIQGRVKWVMQAL